MPGRNPRVPGHSDENLAAAPIARCKAPDFGATGQRIVSKIMGLITAVIGVQFILNGVTTVFVSILKTAK